MLAQKFCVLKEDLTVKGKTHFCEIYLNNFMVDYHDKIKIFKTNWETLRFWMLYFVTLLCLKLRKLQRKPNFDFRSLEPMGKIVSFFE